MARTKKTNIENTLFFLGLTLGDILTILDGMPDKVIAHYVNLWNEWSEDLDDTRVEPDVSKGVTTSAQFNDMLRKVARKDVDVAKDFLRHMQEDAKVIDFRRSDFFKQRMAKNKPGDAKKGKAAKKTPATESALDTPTPNAVILNGRTFTEILRIFRGLDQRKIRAITHAWNEWEDEINRGEFVTRSTMTPAEFAEHMQRVYDSANGFDTVRKFCHYLMHEEGLIDWSKEKVPAEDAPASREAPTRMEIKKVEAASKKGRGVHNLSYAQLTTIRTETIKALTAKGSKQKLRLAPHSDQATTVCENEAVEAVTIQYVDHKMLEVVLILGPIHKNLYRALTSAGDEIQVHFKQIINVREDLTPKVAEVLEHANEKLSLGRNPEALFDFMKRFGAYLTQGGNVYLVGANMPSFNVDKSIVRDIENHEGIIERLIWDRGSDLCKVLCVESDLDVQRLQVSINFADRSRKLEDVLN